VVTREGVSYAAGTDAAFSFVPTEAGAYQVTFTVTDDDGGAETASLAVAVSVAAVQPDPLQPGQSLLVVGGSTGADDIQVSPVGNTGRLAVSIGGVAVGTFEAPAGGPFSGLVVYAQAGDDDVQVAASVAVPAWLSGGDGDDRLKSGSGPAVLLGESGNDLLVGGSARNVLIGGRGADRLVGTGGDDILIGGATAYDLDRGAQALLLGTWVRDDLTYEERMASLTDATRRGGVYLGRETVLNDYDADVLTGASGLDWFWFDAARDRATDLRDQAFENDLDFIDP
jgi:Ca2+-binding RTX toxin-like protein